MMMPLPPLSRPLLPLLIIFRLPLVSYIRRFRQPTDSCRLLPLIFAELFRRARYYDAAAAAIFAAAFLLH